MRKLKNIFLIVLSINFIFSSTIYAQSNQPKEPIWSRVIKGTYFERFNDIKQTNDEGFIVVGYTNSRDYDFSSVKINEDYDAVIFKYNKDGNVEWKKTFGKAGFDSFQSVSVCKDGGYVVAGYTQSNTSSKSKLDDAIIVKYNSSGNIQWQTTLGGGMLDRFSCVLEDDDGYFAVGYSESIDGDFEGKNKGAFDGIVVKLDKKGEIKWYKNFGGKKWDKFYSAIVLNDGYIVVGYSESNDGDLSDLKLKGGEDGIIVKYDKKGDVVWKKNFGGMDDEQINKIETLPDGFVVVGYTYSSDGDFEKVGIKGTCDGFVAKFNLKGNVDWTKTFGGNDRDIFTYIAYKEEYGILATGYSLSKDGELSGLNSGNSDGIVVKYNVDGDMEWKKVYGKGGEDVFLSIVPVDFLGCVLVGYTTSKDFDVTGNEDALILKYEEPRVKVTGIKLDSSSKVVKAGETFKLNVKFIPENATIKKVKWTSSNNSVLKVDENGVVKALKAGEAVVKVKALDGGFEAECKVRVKFNIDNNKLPFYIWANLFKKELKF